MQGAWGKRALSAMAAGYKRNWNNLRGAWGKREMPVAVAKGQFLSSPIFVIVPLQSPLHSPFLPLNYAGVEWSRKRESGWNNLKGLWG